MKITAKEADIQSAETDITGLQYETDNRMIDIYIAQKTNSNLDYVFGDGQKDIIKMSVYQSSVQNQTNSILYELNSKKMQLAEDQATLEQNAQTVEQDKASIEEEQIAIEKSKVDLDQQRAIYQNKRNASLANFRSDQNNMNYVTFRRAENGSSRDTA